MAASGFSTAALPKRARWSDYGTEDWGEDLWDDEWADNADHSASPLHLASQEVTTEPAETEVAPGIQPLQPQDATGTQPS